MIAGMNPTCQKHCFIQLGIPGVILFTEGAACEVRSNAYVKFFEVRATNRTSKMQVKHKKTLLQTVSLSFFCPPLISIWPRTFRLPFNPGFMLGFFTKKKKNA